MRKVLFLLSLIAFIFSLAVGQADAGKGGENKLSAKLRAQIVAKKDYDAKPSSKKFSALKSLGLQEVGSQVVFLHSKTKLSKRSLRFLKRLSVEVNDGSWIPPVGGQTVHTTGFVSAKIPIDKIGKIAKKSFIERIETAEQNLMPMNDLAAESINAIPVWDLGHNGLGIKIAVLDSGLDTSHSDMPTPLVAEDYSNYPSLDDYDVANRITSHGTHVTGSALGRGTLSGGKYKGIAYGADLIFLKVGNDSDSGASSSAVVAAIKAAVDEYGADIINVSYGGFDSFKDGSDEICQAVDYAKSKGVIVFVAAGNEAHRQKHYSGNISANSYTDYIRMDVAGYVSLDMNWFDGLGISNNLHIRLYDSNKQEISVYTFRDAESVRGTELEVLSTFVEDGKYYIRVENNSNTDQLFHLYSLNYWVTFDDADPNYTILTPALADGAVAVASYRTRTSWTNYLGEFYDLGGTIGDISSFSSRGPRIDGLEKPNFATSGESIISARDKIQVLGGADYLIVDNDDVNDGNGPADYLVLQGTSMSCPIAAGGAASLMQANPSLKGNPDALIELLQETSSGGGTRNDTWGYGKINLLAALNAIPTPTPTPTPEITPLPSPTETSAPTPTPIPTPSPDITPIPSPDPTGTSVPSPIPAITPTPLPSPTETSSPEPTPTCPSIPTPVPSPEITPVIPTPSPTPEETPTLEPLPTPTPIVGGGGGGGEPFTEEFEVESTNPKDGAADVRVDGKIEVTIKVKYNQSINGDPLALDRNGSEVEFRAEGTEVNLPVTLDIQGAIQGKDLIIKPSEPLEKGKTYTLKIFRRAIKAANAAGTQMEGDFTMKFTTGT